MLGQLILIEEDRLVELRASVAIAQDQVARCEARIRALRSIQQQKADSILPESAQNEGIQEDSENQ